jgi:hypothetical protein
MHSNLDHNFNNCKHLKSSRVKNIIKKNFPFWNPSTMQKSMLSRSWTVLLMFICTLTFVVSAPLISSVEKILPGNTFSKSALSIPPNKESLWKAESNFTAFEDGQTIPFNYKSHVFDDPAFLKVNKFRVLLLSILIHYKYHRLLDYNNSTHNHGLGLPVPFSNEIQAAHNRVNLATVQKRR